MKLTVDQIIAALPSLNRQDRLAVRAACDLLLQSKGSTDEAAVTLYEHIARGVGSSMPWGRCPAAIKASLSGHAAGFDTFIRDTWPGQTHTHKIMIIRRLLTLLAGDLQVRQVPVTVASIIKNLGRIQDVFDDAYPGYRKGGLAKLVLKHWIM